MSSPGHVGTPEWLTLDRDERVWVRARPSKNLLLITFAVGTALFLALGIVGILFTVDVDTARTVSLVLLLGLFVATAGVYLLTAYREYVVTSHRVCAAAGLGPGSKAVREVPMEEVTAVTLERTAWQSLVNVGDLRFDLEDGTTLRFTAIEQPNRAYERALDSVDGADGSGA